MLQTKSFLAVDFGAANVKVAEFEVSETGGLLLLNYGLKSLGQEGLQEATRQSAMLKTLQELISERGFHARVANVCAPGFNTFSKFVKLPPVDTSKVTQIIQYEAQQNVPFPLEEVVWDYQILGATPTGELEVLLVAIKTDVVEALFKVAEIAGLRIQLADVSPAALCNAFRYNYGDLEGCTMLLDIGAKTSNLLFFEQGNVYSRGINIGANSITQDFSRESKLAYDEAEQVKIAEGFVSLGGAYEEPENPNQAAISKIARQVMTRLHIQVNQTVQYYRGTQGGSAPDRLFLSGGASVMPYTAQFFAEKLNVPVEYFNPLKNVELAEEIDREDLVKVAHSLGEVVGLGLRNLAHCPVELNLMPSSSLRRQELNQKKPYILASMACLILVLFAFGYFYKKVASEKAEALAKLETQARPLEAADRRLKSVFQELRQVQETSAQYTTWMHDRLYWAGILSQMRDIFLAVENEKAQEFKAPTGVWIERLELMNENGPLPMGPPRAANPQGGPGVFRAPAPRAPVQSRNQPRNQGRNQVAANNQAAGGAAPVNLADYDVTRINLYCEGVNMEALLPSNPAANTQLSFAIESALKSNTNLTVAAETELFGDQRLAQDGQTFYFQVTVLLQRPLKF